MMEQKTILVTGGSGFVGARLTLPGALGDSRVVAPTHGEMDLADEGSVRAYIEKIRPDAVIHSAAISHIDVCQREPELSRRINVDGAVSVARACRDIGAKMVFFSSDQVYTGCGGTEPHREDAALSPLNTYACHKVEAEGRVLAICPEAAVLRLSWMYDMPLRGRYTGNNLYTMALRALCTGEPLTVNEDDHRGITYVRQVVDNLPRVLAAPGGVYNYGSLTRLTTEEIYREIFALLGAKHRADALLRAVPTPSGEGRNMMMDPRKAESIGVRFSETVEGFGVMLREYGW